MKEASGVLTREDMLDLLKGQPPLLTGFVNLDEQLQPNGVDLTLREVSAFSSRGNLT